MRVRWKGRGNNGKINVFSPLVAKMMYDQQGHFLHPSISIRVHINIYTYIYTNI